MIIRVSLVSEAVSVGMRFICHIPRAFRTHEEHQYGKKLADKYSH
jgi:hypothetical protein